MCYDRRRAAACVASIQYTSEREGELFYETLAHTATVIYKLPKVIKNKM